MNIFTVIMVPVNPPHDDGAKNTVMRVARRLRGHKFFFVSSFFGKPFPEEDNIRFFRSLFQRQSRHSMALMQKIFIFILILLNIRRMDLFQFFITPQPYFSGIFSKILRKRNKMSIQVIPSIHTLYEKNSKGVDKGLFFGDRVVVCSDFAKRKIEALGVNNVTRIYPGIDTARFEKSGIKEKETEGLVLLKGKRNVIYPGAYKVLEKAYSVERFATIAERVLEKDTNVNFVMACRMRTREDAVLRRKFRKIIKEKELEGNFIFLETVNDMAVLLNMCDIAIMPAIRPMSGVLEIPMVLLEMACLERTVIYGGVSPLEELRDKGIGVMIESDSPESYAEKILDFLGNGKLARSAAKTSGEAVRRYFSMDNAALEYGRIYDSLEGNKK